MDGVIVNEALEPQLPPPPPPPPPPPLPPLHQQHSEPPLLLPLRSDREMDLLDGLRVADFAADDAGNPGAVRLLIGVADHDGGRCGPPPPPPRPLKAPWAAFRCAPDDATPSRTDDGCDGTEDLHAAFAADAAVAAARAGCRLGDARHAPGAAPVLDAAGRRSGAWVADAPRRGVRVFEPPDHAKGRVARGFLYAAMWHRERRAASQAAATRASTATDPFGDPFERAAVLRWHRAHPPDEAEEERNDIVESLQGNRNPLVDCPSFAEFVF